MGQIKPTIETTIDAPSAGSRALAPKSDGWYDKDSSGVEKKLGNADDAVATTSFDAKGDILIGTANDAYTNLATPTLTAGDGDNTLILSDDTNTVAWGKHQSNSLDLRYMASATYTVDYATDHMITGIATTDMTISFSEPNDYFQVTGRGKEFLFKNGSEDYLVTVKLDGTSEFQNGLNEVKIYPRGTLKVGVVKSNIADGYFLLQSIISKLQARYDTTWASSNFSTVTAIPYNVNDLVEDDNIVDHDITTNNSRIVFKTKGRATVTFWFGIDSTGGASYRVSGYMRKNGTTTISGSNYGFGNYQTEDTHVCVGPIIVDHAANDYIEVMADQNNLTGNMYDMVVHVEDVL